MSKVKIFVFIYFFLISPLALAQEEPLNDTLPQGEKLDFGKKFYPTTNDAEFIFELNPLLLIRRGFEIETEYKIKPSVTVGFDIVWFDSSVFDENGVKANVGYYGVEPKVRFYPLQRLDGVFMTGRLAIGTYVYKISSTQTWSKEIMTVAPIVQVGYRITSFSGFTFSGYIGGGFNLRDPKADITTLTSESEKSARSKLNDTLTRFRPDFGLTFGMAI